MRLLVKKAMLGELPLDDDKPKKKKKEVEAPLEPPPQEEWYDFCPTLFLGLYLSHAYRVIEKPAIPAVQDDIVKLTAQFVACNGRAFQNGLLARESNVRNSVEFVETNSTLECTVRISSPISPASQLFQSPRSTLHKLPSL